VCGQAALLRLSTVQQRSGERGLARKAFRPKEGQACRIGPGLDGTLNGGKRGVAGNCDAKDVSPIIAQAAELYSYAGRRDVEFVKVVLKSLEG